MLKKFFLIFIAGLSMDTAQAYSAISSINTQNLTVVENLQEIKILAVMVEFQPDDFELTYGDGTFGSIYSQDYGNEILDPLPHDKNYFEDHLEFAVNYYEKVSNGKVSISYSVLPEIFTVSKPMREYSPVQGEQFTSLADFSEEVWELVDNSNLNIDFSQYNTFLIFHAGVGKDISTSDLFGEARDLPSIFLGLNTLNDFYGDSFQGFEVGNNEFITNTIILPETESREERGIGGTSLIELSINGLIVSSIASRIGLPDLFDAETGKSAIGRFGLMDGQSLFAYAGLFPPEPSAWEKIFLGWEEPLIIDNNSDDIAVVTSRISETNTSRIIKIPLNSSEYYLIENRNRDVNSDGVTITYKVAGQTRTINFMEDLDNFNNSFVDTLSGVILDVDEYDWALPGNGILIWHIDEKIISNQISENRINVGDQRGVDLEEADGIQDIGEEFQTIFGDIIIAEGDEFDFWYSGNTSELYQNEFGISTKPNTLTNTGANSLIRITDFSIIGNRMTFDVNFGSSEISLKNRFLLDSNLTLSNFKLSNVNDSISSYFTSDNSLYRLGNTTEVINNFSNVNFAILSTINKEIAIGGLNKNLNIAIFNSGDFTNSSVELGSNISAPITIQDVSQNEIDIYVGLEDGTLSIYRYNYETQDVPVLMETNKIFNTPVQQLLYDDGGYAIVSENKISISDLLFTFPSEIKIAATTKKSSGQYQKIILANNNSIYSIVEGNDLPELIFEGENEIESFALADLKNDGNNYVLFNSKSEIYAINLTGSYAEHFPIEISPQNDLIGFPIVCDLNGDNQSDIISASENGNIYAFSGKDGNYIQSFPISIGDSFIGNFSILGKENIMLFSAANSSNEIYFWEINIFSSVGWNSEFGNNFNNAYLKSADDQNLVSQYFPSNRTYNWPNPVYENETYIRTYVSEDSKVQVKVFDISGDLVDEFEFFANGGFDTEYSWNVSDVQSGAYFAHLEVKSNSGKTESKILKIAVIK